MTPSQPSHPARSRPARLRVLIVEGSPGVALSARRLLEMDGHEVNVARDGLAGLEAAAAVGPDVILLDIGLPGLDGYEVVEQLKGRKAKKRVLLVAVTGYATDADRERSAAGGIDLHHLKPVEPAFLLGLQRRFANYQNPATVE